VTSLIANTDDARDVGTLAKDQQASRIRDLYDKGVKDIRQQILEYQENAAFLDGQQWVYRHRQTNQIVEIPRNARKSRATVPRLGPESRRLFSKLLKRPLAFSVIPDAPDDETIRGAAIAQGVIEDLARRQKWGRIREENAWQVWKGGTAALALDWDASAGAYLGQSDMGRPVGEGDVRVTSLAITEMVTEVGTRDVERACYWIKAQALPPAEVKKMYRLPELPAADASSANSPIQAKLARTGTNGEVPKPLTLVLTFYERPNVDNKTGTVATVVGDKVVDGPHDWPFPFTDRLNLVAVRETMIEGRWTGRTVVCDAVPVQTVLNHVHTSITEHLKQAGNARMQNSSVERNNGDNWTDEPGEFVYFDDQPWQWLSPPPMPDWWGRLPDMYESTMDDIIGVHDISRGEAPSNIESGLGLSVLAEQDDTPTGKLAQTLADAWGDIATMILQTLERNVLPTESRTAQPDNPRASIQERFTWNGLSFAGQTVCTVPYEAVAPINESARFAKAMALMDREVISGGPQLSAFLDLPGNDFITRINPQVAKARRENYQLAQNEACIPAEFDNHATHIEEHNVFRLSAAYERLDEQARGLVDMHVKAHEMLAMEEMARQQYRMMNMPGMAIAAQANQPPGSATPMSPQEPGAMPQMAPQAGAEEGAPQDEVLGARMGGNPEETAAPDDENPTAPPLGMPGGPFG
jgi:hypothetical protein